MTAVRFWLEFLVTINGNILLNKQKGPFKNSSKLNQEMFQRLLHRIAVHLQSKMKDIIVNDPNDIFEFVKSQWSRSQDANFQLTENVNYPETVIITATMENKKFLIQIGLLTGEFLVNNLPISRLPSSITGHSDFQRVFQDFIFEVQEANGRFDSKYKYKDCYYSFHCNDSGVFITERKQNGDEYELIPEKIFSDEIPFLLVENHSHWWCKAENLIEFRPICFSDANFSLEVGVQYKLDLNGGRLTHTKSKKIMLDVTSGSYKKIARQLSRLESPKYIHILMDEPGIGKIELVRMNIKFLVDASNPKESYDVISNEFNGMRVSLGQDCGSLYGLHQGLLLESIPDGKTEQKKLMILPHGKVTAHPMGDHEVVEINVESTLRTPSFFIYQMDEVCQQLKSINRSHSAWFYLAYLHALTSHGLPDKFTELSGTERALQILQSAFAWSTAPYDDEALVTLKLIEKLAPSRRIKSGMHSVRWPDHIESHAAQDGFLLITNKLIADSKRLDQFYSKDKPISPTKKTAEMKNSNSNNETDLNVCVREYFRSLPYFPNLRVADTFVKHKTVPSAHYIHNERDDTLHAIRTISNSYHQLKFISPQLFSMTEYLTKSDQNLKGPRNVDDDDEILDRFMSELRGKWLSLYNVARSSQFSREKFALLLGLLAHENTGSDDLNAILVLQTVSENRFIFNGIDPPNIENYELVNRRFNNETIEKILEQHKNDLDFTGRYNEQREIRYVISTQDYIRKVVSKIREMWPCDEVHPSIYQLTNPNVNLRDAVIEINHQLRKWRDVERLTEFLRRIDMQIRRLNVNAPPIDTLLPWYPEKMPFKHMGKFYVDFDAKVIENLPGFEAEVIESQQIGTQSTNDGEKDWWSIYKSIASPNDAQHLLEAGMWPRLVLSLVLPKLLSSTQNPKLKSIICAVGVQTVSQQRQQRIANYSQKPEMKAALEQEEKYEPHTNWLPSEYPEWLLFEIEQDLTIRPIQIDVAKRMISPPEIGTKHSVMQLNMGEGKTAVIVPILAAILANGRQVCQVTVLKSLFATNMKELRQCLGGMLNRRLYTFPCRRDMPINKHAKKILDLYVECRSVKGDF